MTLRPRPGSRMRRSPTARTILLRTIYILTIFLTIIPAFSHTFLHSLPYIPTLSHSMLHALAATLLHHPKLISSAIYNRHMDVEAIVQSLTKYLEFGKAPKGLAQAYRDAAKADQNSTERIFLDAGSSAWFAYFLTKRTLTQGHFVGRARLNELIQSLEEAPPDHRRLLAQQVRQSIPPTTLKKFQQVLDRVVQTQRDRTPKSREYTR